MSLLDLTNVNQVSTAVIDATRNFPPFVQQAVGDKLGQVGNSNILSALQDIAARQGGGNPVASVASKLFLGQQSPFPVRKYVSFYLMDRNGKLAPVSDPNEFKPGYAFNMTVNPKNFKITLPAKTVVPARTLGGWRLQHWYPEIGNISASGIIGNMLERFNRDLKDSTAWRGFKKLMNIYAQNGIPYIPNGANANRILAQNQFFPNAVCIYDKIRYVGYFESLNYEESEDTPHTVGYDFSFKFVNMTSVDDISVDSQDKSAIDSIKTTSIDSRIGNVVLPPSTVNSVFNSFKLG
jgi:hypothetical protein